MSRWVRAVALVLAALAALAVLVAAQVDVPAPFPIERPADFVEQPSPALHPRADKPKTTDRIPTPTQSASSDKNHIEHGGTADDGDTASITADTNNGTCEYDNELDSNQQAAWSDTWISTCCTNEKNSICWYRLQDKVSADVACKIPNCATLNSNDQSRMMGFRPLSGTNGEGKFQNIFPIIFLSGAVKPALPVLLFVVAPLVVSLILLV